MRARCACLEASFGTYPLEVRQRLTQRTEDTASLVWWALRHQAYDLCRESRLHEIARAVVCAVLVYDFVSADSFDTLYPPLATRWPANRSRFGARSFKQP